jgi:Predicted membrane protein
MTWIWISIIVVLVGAKLNAEMEHQTVHESTTGQAKADRETRGKNGRHGWGSTGLRSGLTGMLTISEAQRRTELFLTGQMLEALRAVEYELPSFDTQLHDVDLAEVARARVEIRHVRGASDATYLITAFGEELLMQLQLNVHRLVVVYRVPALDALDARPLRYVSNVGASAPSMPAGNSAGAIRRLPATRGRRFVETYCYAFAGIDFLEVEPQQLYWRTDIVQMTRYYMIEAAHRAFASRPAAPDSRCKPVLMSRPQGRYNAIGIS